jgi:branched-chain amino acid transport system permease protein
LRGDYLAIVTLGFGEIVRVLLQQTPTQLDSTEAFNNVGWFGVIWPPAMNGALGFRDLPKVTNLLWTYLFVGLTILVAYRIKTSSYGRALLSIREDEIAAESMGINVAKLKVRAFILAAFFAGVAGALYAHQPGNLLTPKDAGFIRSFDIVMMVVLGGLGSISGSVLAAIVITLLNAWLVPLGPYRMIIFALALILTMIFRPQGLFGLREVWDFWKKHSPRRHGDTERETKMQKAEG